MLLNFLTASLYSNDVAGKNNGGSFYREPLSIKRGHPRLMNKDVQYTTLSAVVTRYPRTASVIFQTYNDLFFGGSPRSPIRNKRGSGGSG